MNQPSVLKHVRDILILPFTMTVIVPYLCYEKAQKLFASNILFLVLGVVILLMGLSLFAWTVYLFRTFGKGTLAPWTPTQKLIIRGPYKYCRNPMITGVFSILLGETLILNSVNLLIFAAIFFIINTIYFIFKEEPDLKERFGEDYQKYKQNVPRWIPRLKPYSG